MGKMLLGGFAVSLGLAGLVGIGGPSPNAAVGAAAVIKQQKKQALTRSTYPVQIDNTVEQAQEDLSVQRRLAEQFNGDK